LTQTNSWKGFNPGDEAQLPCGQPWWNEHVTFSQLCHAPKKANLEKWWQRVNAGDNHMRVGLGSAVHAPWNPMNPHAAP
jgi:hypothetical protein